MKKITFPKGGTYYYKVKVCDSMSSLDILKGESVEAPELKVEDLDGNLAEIDFIPLDENVRIIELRNFKALQEIEKEYGKKVRDEYVDFSEIYMYKFVNLVVVSSGMFTDSVGEDSILSKPEFETLIPIMKKAGKRLHRIVQKYKKMRTVEI